MKENVITPEFRASYPQVFRAKRNDLNGKDEFSVMALFDAKADLSKLKAAAEAAIVEKWGADKEKWPQNLRSPFRKQAEKEKNGKLPEGYSADGIFITLRSTQKPGLINQKNDDIIDETEFYGGCYARASVRAYAYDQRGNRGVAFGLQNIQKLRDGEPLAGRPKAQDEFEPVEAPESGPSPAKKGAGSIFD